MLLLRCRIIYVLEEACMFECYSRACVCDSSAVCVRERACILGGDDRSAVQYFNCDYAIMFWGFYCIVIVRGIGNVWYGVWYVLSLAE